MASIFSDEEFVPEKVNWGSRAKVVNPATSPYKAVVKVESDFDGDGTIDRVGSGVLIGDNDVLTSPWLLWRLPLGRTSGEYAQRIIVTASDKAPVTVISGNHRGSNSNVYESGKNLHIPLEYQDLENKYILEGHLGIGVINLPSNLGNEISVSIENYNILNRDSLTLVGYPTDLDDGRFLYSNPLVAENMDPLGSRSFSDATYKGRTNAGFVYWDGSARIAFSGTDNHINPTEVSSGYLGAPLFNSRNAVVGLHGVSNTWVGRGGSDPGGPFSRIVSLSSDIYDRVLSWTADSSFLTPPPAATPPEMPPAAAPPATPPATPPETPPAATPAATPPETPPETPPAATPPAAATPAAATPAATPPETPPAATPAATPPETPPAATPATTSHAADPVAPTAVGFTAPSISDPSLSSSPSDNASEDNLLLGSTIDDSIEGGAGNDTLYGNEGNDTLYGKDKNDLLLGNQGYDQLYGGLGSDTLYGGRSNDTLYGGKDDDLLLGNKGNDLLFGDNGNDTLYGGKAQDTLYGGNGNDLLFGDEGDDALYNDNGADTLSGGNGNDTFYYNDIPDTPFHNDGDQFIGDAGEDTMVFSKNYSDYRFTRLADGRLQIDDAASLSEIEWLHFVDRKISTLSLLV